jgi:putative ABC transport system permease protein
MSLREILALALASLRASTLRSALTMLGIAVGVFSVIGVMTVISGLRGSIESGLNVLGANSFQVTKFPAINFSDPRQRFANRRDLDFAQSVRFRELMEADGLAEVSMQLNRGGLRVTHLDRRTNPNVRLIGTDARFVFSFNYEIESGRNLEAGDIEFGRPVALLGADVASRVFPDSDPLGQAVRVDGRIYTVVGLLKSKGTSFGQSQDNFVAVPITQFLDVYGRARRSISINVQAASQEAFDDTVDRAIGVMRLVRGLEPEDPNDFEVFSNDSLIEAFNNIAGVVAVAAFVISAIALVASGVGVMNIMLVSVTERTKEIGIRKSIGARKTDILTQFLLEAVVLSLCGGLAGVVVGVLGGNAASMFLNAGIVFPWAWAAAGVLVCGGIGVAFGLYPAWKAASLDPIEALRHE